MHFGVLQSSWGVNFSPFYCHLNTIYATIVVQGIRFETEESVEGLLDFPQSRVCVCSKRKARREAVFSLSPRTETEVLCLSVFGSFLFSVGLSCILELVSPPCQTPFSNPPGLCLSPWWSLPAQEVLWNIIFHFLQQSIHLRSSRCTPTAENAQTHMFFLPLTHTPGVILYCMHKRRTFI